MIKYSAAKEEDKPKVMASIVEGIRGDAAELAKDIGIEELLKKDTGLEKLTAEIKKSIFPKVTPVFVIFSRIEIETNKLLKSIQEKKVLSRLSTATTNSSTCRLVL